MCTSLNDGRSIVCADSALDFIVALIGANGGKLMITAEQGKAAAKLSEGAYLVATKPPGGGWVLTLTNGDDARAIEAEVQQRRAKQSEALRKTLSDLFPAEQEPMPPGKSH